MLILVLTLHILVSQKSEMSFLAVTQSITEHHLVCFGVHVCVLLCRVFDIAAHLSY
jgi:hypothetical protein